MANPHKGEMAIMLDRQRLLKLSFNAICEAEAVVGHPVLRRDLGLSEIRAILWAGLKHEDRALTLDDVGDLLEQVMKQNRLPEISGKVGDAIRLFFGTGEAVGAGATQTG